MIRLFVVTPLPAWRVGLRTMLEEEGTLELAGSSPTLVGVGELLAACDVLLLADEEQLDELEAQLPDEVTLGVLLLSEGLEGVAWLRAMPLRGWGILPPESSAAELRAAAGAIAEGLVVVPPTAGARILAPAPEEEGLYETLTEREREVLELLSRGHSNKMVARELQISEHTVKFHISALFGKLGASSRTEAVSRGARYGLITL